MAGNEFLVLLDDASVALDEKRTRATRRIEDLRSVPNGVESVELLEHEVDQRNGRIKRTALLSGGRALRVRGVKELLVMTERVSMGIREKS